MRTLTRMLAWMMIGGPVHAAAPIESPPLFLSCDEALATREFAALDGVIPGQLRPQLTRCMRLTRREFLLVSEGSGPWGNFHYCDLREASPKCEPADPGRSYYNLQLKRQFTGANGKRYMLWETGNLKAGVYTGGYGIFTLVPRSQAPRGFTTYSLPVGTIRNMGDGPDNEPCHRLEREQAREVTGYTIEGEGTAAIELRFEMTVTDCATSATTQGRTIFRLEDGRFEQIP